MAESLTSIVLATHLRSLSDSKRGTPIRDGRELSRFVVVTPLKRFKPSSAVNNDEKPKLSVTPIPLLEKVRVVIKAKSRTPSVALPSVSPQLFLRDTFFPSNSRLSTHRIPLRRDLLDQAPSTRSARGGGFSYISKQGYMTGFLQHKSKTLLRNAFHEEITGKRMLEFTLAWRPAKKPGETVLGSG